MAGVQCEDSHETLAHCAGDRRSKAAIMQSVYCHTEDLVVLDKIAIQAHVHADPFGAWAHL